MEAGGRGTLNAAKLESPPCKLWKDLGTGWKAPGYDYDFQVGGGATTFCVAQRAQLRVCGGDGKGKMKR